LRGTLNVLVARISSKIHAIWSNFRYHVYNSNVFLGITMPQSAKYRARISQLTCKRHIIHINDRHDLANSSIQHLQGRTVANAAQRMRLVTARYAKDTYQKLRYLSLTATI
jgi:hypothetical protein